MAERNELPEDLEQPVPAKAGDREETLEDHETRLEETHREALHGSPEWSRAIAEAATRAGLGLTISVLDGDPRLVYASAGAAEILGRPVEELVGGPPIPVLSPDEEDRLRRQETDAPRFLESEIVRPDGTEVPVEVGLSLGTYWGRPAKVAFLRDITDRRTAEEALAEREEQLQSIWTNTTVGLYRTTPDGEVVDVNPALAAMFGYGTADAMEGLDVEETFYSEETWRGDWRRTVEDAGDVRGLQATYRRRDGSELHVRESVHVVRDDDGDVRWYEGTMEDVTGLVEAQRRLSDANDRLQQAVSLYEATLDSTADGILVVDLEGEIVDYNDRFAEMWDIPEKVLETSDDEAIAYVLDQLEHPQRFLDRVEELYDAPMEDSFDVLEFEDGRVFERVSRPQVLDDEPVGRVWSFRDVTEQRRIQADLERSNEDFQRFAYALSHDLREPLRMVTSFLGLLEEELGDDLDADAREYLDFARDGASRAQGMIGGLLELSRVRTRGDPLEPTDLGAVVDAACDQLRLRIAEASADVEVGEMPQVLGDADQLAELFQNLLDNAIKYGPDDGPARVRIAAEDAGDRWTIRVADDGPGMDETTVERAFDVFQRGPGADDVAEGSGLGLTLCKRIVERHGGRIYIESAAGEGTTVVFTLPKPDDGPTVP